MRVFTPDEANAALPAVRSLVERLVAARREHLGALTDLGEVESAVAANGGRLDPGRVGELRESAEAAGAAVGSLVAEIQELGVQVKDLDRGLVDFPARHPRTMEEVLLCWELGEPEIAYWHGVAEGFAGRKPLPF